MNPIIKKYCKENQLKLEFVCNNDFIASKKYPVIAGMPRNGRGSNNLKTIAKKRRYFIFFVSEDCADDVLEGMELKHYQNTLDDNISPAWEDIIKDFDMWNDENFTPRKAKVYLNLPAEYVKRYLKLVNKSK